MNLSEALDAALPEIPRARLTLAHPPRLDPELIVREDLMEGDPIVGVFQRSKGNYFRFAPVQWRLASLFDGVRSYEEIGQLFEQETGSAMPAEAVRVFAQNMDESDFWYKSPQERNIALKRKAAGTAEAAGPTALRAQRCAHQLLRLGPGRLLHLAEREDRAVCLQPVVRARGCSAVYV